MRPAKAGLNPRAPQRSLAVRIIFDGRGLKHLHKRDAHALGNGGDILQNWHKYEYTETGGELFLHAMRQTLWLNQIWKSEKASPLSWDALFNSVPPNQNVKCRESCMKRLLPTVCSITP